MLESDVGEYGTGRHVVQADLAALDRLADEYKQQSTCLVHELYNRLVLTDIFHVLSQFAGTVLKYLGPALPRSY